MCLNREVKGMNELSTYSISYMNINARILIIPKRDTLTYELVRPQPPLPFTEVSRGKKLSSFVLPTYMSNLMKMEFTFSERVRGFCECMYILLLKHE